MTEKKPLTIWREATAGERTAVLSMLEAVATPLALGAANVLRLLAERATGFRRAFGERILVVEGRSRFPLEQLQRDACVPMTESDALSMYREFRCTAPARRVVLRRFVESAGDAPGAARWASFGWSVVFSGSRDEYDRWRINNPDPV